MDPITVAGGVIRNAAAPQRVFLKLEYSL